MAQLFANNARTTLQLPALAGDGTLTVVDGSRLPSPTGGDYFYFTLASGAPESAWEVVKVTARTGNTLTVVRAQDGTTAQGWAAGTKAELRLPAQALRDILSLFILKAGDSGIGNLGMAALTATVGAFTDLSVTNAGSSRIGLVNSTATTGKTWIWNSYSDGKLYLTCVGTGDVFNMTPSGAATFVSSLAATSASLSATLGVGTAASTTVGVHVNGVSLTSSTPNAFFARITAPSSAITYMAGYQSYLSTAAAAFTLGTMYGFVDSGIETLGAGSSVTNRYGFYAGSNSAASTLNVAFGTNQAAGTGCYAFRATGGAQSYFGGPVTVASTLAVTAGHIDITGGGTNPYYSLFDGTDTTYLEVAGGAFDVHHRGIQAFKILATGNATFNNHDVSMGVLTATMVNPGYYTVATLPAGTNGGVVYASNGRKVGEGAGAGTGSIVVYSNGAWRRPSDETAILA